MPQASVLEQFPSLEDVERDLSVLAREQRLLRSIRDAMRRRQKQEKAARLNREFASLRNGEAANED